MSCMLLGPVLGASMPCIVGRLAEKRGGSLLAGLGACMALPRSSADSAEAAGCSLGGLAILGRAEGKTLRLRGMRGRAGFCTEAWGSLGMLSCKEPRLALREGPAWLPPGARGLKGLRGGSRLRRTGWGLRGCAVLG